MAVLRADSFEIIETIGSGFHLRANIGGNHRVAKKPSGVLCLQPIDYYGGEKYPFVSFATYEAAEIALQFIEVQT